MHCSKPCSYYFCRAEAGIVLNLFLNLRQHGPRVFIIVFIKKKCNRNQGCGSSQIFNAFASSSSWSFMLPKSLPLPHLWNFLLPLPALDRISCFRVPLRFQSLSSKCFRFRFHKNLIASTASSFRFHIPVCNSCDWLSTRFHKLQMTLLGLLGSATCHQVQQPQQTKKEPTITTSWPLMATVKPRNLMPW